MDGGTSSHEGRGSSAGRDGSSEGSGSVGVGSVGAGNSLGVGSLGFAFGLLSGNILARMIAVLLAGASLIANFLYMPAYPVWALTVIAIDVFVIFAVTAHGRDLA